MALCRGPPLRNIMCINVSQRGRMLGEHAWTPGPRHGRNFPTEQPLRPKRGPIQELQKQRTTHNRGGTGDGPDNRTGSPLPDPHPNRRTHTKEDSLKSEINLHRD